MLPKYDTFKPRFAAGFVDGLVFSPVSYGYLWFEDLITNRPLLVVGYILVSFAFVTYSVLMHGLYGQTIGKKLCRVIVLDVTEASLSMKQAIIRESPCILATIIAVPFGIYRILQGETPNAPESFSNPEVLLGYVLLVWFVAEFVTMLSNPTRRAIHDYLAGSVVVCEDEVGSSPIFS